MAPSRNSTRCIWLGSPEGRCPKRGATLSKIAIEDLGHACAATGPLEVALRVTRDRGPVISYRNSTLPPPFRRTSSRILLPAFTATG